MGRVLPGIARPAMGSVVPEGPKVWSTIGNTKSSECMEDVAVSGVDNPMLLSKLPKLP